MILLGTLAASGLLCVFHIPEWVALLPGLRTRGQPLVAILLASTVPMTVACACRAMLAGYGAWRADGFLIDDFLGSALWATMVTNEGMTRPGQVHYLVAAILVFLGLTFGGLYWYLRSHSVADQLEHQMGANHSQDRVHDLPVRWFLWFAQLAGTALIVILLVV
jgi:hypothetical protein